MMPRPHRVVSPHPTHSTMTSSPNHEKAIAIAISLLKHKNPQTTQTLKDLLTFIPNPNHVKNVLTTAVIELIDKCPQAALWLFQNPEVIEPEIRVKEIIAQELTRKIVSWGYTAKDFHFTTDYALEMSDDAQRSLLSQSFALDEPALLLVRALLKT